jgi:phosphoribosylanthranilate isomerase
MVVDAGADAVGFVVNVPESPRNLTLDRARELIDCTPVFVETVAVTMANDPADLERLCSELSPDILQVHGVGPDRFQGRLRFPGTKLIGAVQVRPSLTAEDVARAMERFDAVLLDSYSRGKHGGTGVSHDWELSRRIRDLLSPRPVILAGGLNAENVRAAIGAVSPYGVDVSSGVEVCPGTKDPEKLMRFMRNVEEA